MRLLFLLPIVGLLAACAVMGDVEAPLNDARTAYREAALDAHAQAHAPVELRIAQQSLGQAERLARESADSGLVAHHAYLATQRARTARELGQARAAQAARAQAAAQAAQQAERSRSEALEAKARQAEIARTEAELQLKETQRQQVAVERDLGDEMKRLQQELAQVKAQQSAQRTERGWIVTLRSDLLFDGGSAVLTPGAQRSLESVAQFLQRNPARDIAIEGFTDSTGTPEGNRRLSEHRAAAVKEALVRQGVEPARIDARGYGPAFPVATNATPTGRQLNRRVEIIINPS
jgi:outer membrane protein OmpA-like peptidoglycan-associated protein